MPKERKYENYWKWILFVTVGTNVCIYNPSYVNTDGISIMNVIDFLKDTEMGLL